MCGGHGKPSWPPHTPHHVPINAVACTHQTIPTTCSSFVSGGGKARRAAAYTPYDADILWLPRPLMMSTTIEGRRLHSQDPELAGVFKTQPLHGRSSFFTQQPFLPSSFFYLFFFYVFLVVSLSSSCSSSFPFSGHFQATAIANGSKEGWERTFASTLSRVRQSGDRDSQTIVSLPLPRPDLSPFLLLSSLFITCLRLPDPPPVVFASSLVRGDV
eukprot:TRINITY_DN417_c0_g1_i12.p1 TRINITY_DN417_c0_g1~~TRINITY_DN417_c0_g1_i12.p1  ORF type:complete len:215 (-),score=30.51 TRINITY_DN417_c0_g1_i12:247-891(-)